MIALYIILGIILLICLILLLRVRLIINFENDLNVYFRLLFIKFSLYPEKTKFRFRKRKKKKKLKSNTSQHTSNQEETQKKEESIVKRLWSIRSVLLHTIEKFLGKVHFKFVKLHVVVGCENAASTALLYGTASQGVAYLIEILDNISNVDISKNSDVSITSDFVSQKSSLTGKIVLYISVAHILYVLVQFLKQFIKSKMKNGG